MDFNLILPHHFKWNLSNVTNYTWQTILRRLFNECVCVCVRVCVRVCVCVCVMTVIYFAFKIDGTEELEATISESQRASQRLSQPRSCRPLIINHESHLLIPLMNAGPGQLPSAKVGCSEQDNWSNGWVRGIGNRNRKLPRFTNLWSVQQSYRTWNPHDSCRVPTLQSIWTKERTAAALAWHGGHWPCDWCRAATIQYRFEHRSFRQLAYFLGRPGRMIALVDTASARVLILCLTNFNFSQSFRHASSTMGGIRARSWDAQSSYAHQTAAQCRGRPRQSGCR